MLRARAATRRLPATARTRVFASHVSTESALAQALKRHLQRDYRGLLDIFVSSAQATVRAASKRLEAARRGRPGAEAR
jgi:hypothetical protein